MTSIVQCLCFSVFVFINKTIFLFIKWRLLWLHRHSFSGKHADKRPSPRPRQNHLADVAGQLWVLGDTGTNTTEALPQQHRTRSGQRREYTTKVTKLFKVNIFSIVYECMASFVWARWRIGEQRNNVALRSVLWSLISWPRSTHLCIR